MALELPDDFNGGADGGAVELVDGGGAGTGTVDTAADEGVDELPGAGEVEASRASRALRARALDRLSVKACVS